MTYGLIIPHIARLKVISSRPVGAWQRYSILDWLNSQ